jgi:hypothetical protein
MSRYLVLREVSLEEAISMLRREQTEVDGSRYGLEQE